MNYLKEAIDAFSAILDTFILYTMFGTVLGEKAISSRKITFFYIVYAVLIIVVGLLINNQLLILFLMFLLSFVMSLFYRNKYFVKIFACFTIGIMAVLTEILAGVALAISTRQSVAILSTNPVYYVEGVLIAKALLLIFVKAIQYKKMPSGSRISKILFLPLLALPATTFFIIFVMSEYAYKLAQTQSVIIVAVASVLLIISNILVFFLFEKQLKQDEQTRSETLARQQLQYQTAYYKEIAERYKQSNKTVHNTKNLLFAISILLGKNEVEKAKEKIDELTDTAFSGLNMIRSGNEALDALLNTKAQVLETMQISFKPNVFINPVNQIDDIDLCVIVGNALDNAIEACSKISGENSRFITLHMMQTNDLMTIEMTNPSLEEPARVNGKIVTAKNDKALHGFGLQSIEEIVNKYNGKLSVCREDGVFSLKLYMHNEIS